MSEGSARIARNGIMELSPTTSNAATKKANVVQKTAKRLSFEEKKVHNWNKFVMLKIKVC